MCPSAIKLDTQYILCFIFQTIEVASCDCCITKIMSIIVLCESDIEQITICHLRALALENANAILFYHSKNSFYHYTILFYNTSTSQNSISIKILFFNLSLFLLSNRHFFPDSNGSTFTNHHTTTTTTTPHHTSTSTAPPSSITTPPPPRLHHHQSPHHHQNASA